MKFSIKDFFSKCDQIRSFLRATADLVTFTEEILIGNLHFLCSVACDILKFLEERSWCKSIIKELKVPLTDH